MWKCGFIFGPDWKEFAGNSALRAVRSVCKRKFSRRAAERVVHLAAFTTPPRRRTTKANRNRSSGPVARSAARPAVVRTSFGCKLHPADGVRRKCSVDTWPRTPAERRPSRRHLISALGPSSGVGRLLRLAAEWAVALTRKLARLARSSSPLVRSLGQRPFRPLARSLITQNQRRQSILNISNSNWPRSNCFHIRRSAAKAASGLAFHRRRRSLKS